MKTRRTRYTSIPGLMDDNQDPRVGKIKLGQKEEKFRDDGTPYEYPKKTDFFVVPPEVAAIYGGTPRRLDVMLPSNNIEECCPVSYKYYKSGPSGKSILWCTGNGIEGSRIAQDGSYIQVDCTCEHYNPDEKKKKCRRMANLMVILPEVSIGGVYQIDTGSINSISNIYAGARFAAKYTQGSITMVPFTLSLKPKDIVHEGRPTTIFVMHLALSNFETMKKLMGSMNDIRAMIQGRPQIEAPPIPEPEFEEDLVPQSIQEQEPEVEDARYESNGVEDARYESNGVEDDPGDIDTKIRTAATALGKSAGTIAAMLRSPDKEAILKGLMAQGKATAAPAATEKTLEEKTREEADNLF